MSLFPKRSRRGLNAAGLAIVIAAGAVTPAIAQQTSEAVSASGRYDQAFFDRNMKALSNWGRWGKDDQLGTLNYITPTKRLQAFALARKGIVVSMQGPIVPIPAPPEQAGTNIPQGVSTYEIRFRTIPPGDPHHNDGFDGEFERYNPHGNFTHLDALCHDSDGKGHLYNGYDLASSVSETTGCRKEGLGALPQGAIITRGVLIDMTRLKASHTAGAPVTVKDIEAWEKQAKVHVSPGDALFVYNPGPSIANGQPRRGGFDLSVLPWMRARGVALTSGFYSGSIPGWGGQVPGVFSADHRLTLSEMGLPLLDSPNLKPVSDEAARQNRWEFLLIVAPAAMPGSTGALVNPLAIF
jgi:hypothetical protein